MKNKTNPVLNSSLKLFMSTMILANVASKMESTLLPLYIQELGADISQVGLFFTLAAIVPLFLQVLGGWLSDVIGRLKAIALGSIGGMLGYAMLLFAPSWEWLLIAAAARAMAHAFVGPSYQAFIAEQADEDQLGQLYATTDTIYRIVGVIGPPLGGFLAYRFSFKIMFVVAGLLYTTATIVRIGMARAAGQHSDGNSQRPTLSRLKANLSEVMGLLVGGGTITWIFITDGAQDITFELSNKLTPLYLENLIGLTTTQIGLLSSVLFACTMLFMIPAGRFSDHHGEHASIFTGFILYVVAQGLFLISQSFGVFVIVWLLYGLGVAFVRPAYNSLISKVVPNRLRGIAFGVFSTSLGMFSLPIPYLGGLLWDQVGVRVPFAIPIVAILIVLPMVWLKLRPPDSILANKGIS